MHNKRIINVLKSISGYLATGLAASAIASTFIAKSASAVSLTSLQSGGTITSSGIVFSNFVPLTATTLGGAIPVSSDAVTVNAISGGIEFVFPLFAGTNQVNDVAWGYTATAPSTLSLLNLTTVGAASGTGVGSIGETVFNAGTTVSGSVSTFASPSTLIAFTPSSSIRVLKDLNVAGGTNGFAAVSIVDQTFPSIPNPNPNVSVPEPSEVIGTFLFGVLSAGYVLKRQRRSQVA